MKEQNFNFEELVNLNNKGSFSFLLVGRTGVGKSSTINSLMGENIAPVGDYEPTTLSIQNYKSQIGGIDIIVNDSPGLCDDLEEEGKDYQYLEMIRSQLKEVDCMWFVSRLDETRVSSDEKRGIKLISHSFTPEIWKKAVILFTFAGNVDPIKYPDALQKRTELIRKEISTYTGVQIANNIPSVGVDNKNPLTPDGNKWLGELYSQVFSRLSEEGVLPWEHPICAMSKNT